SVCVLVVLSAEAEIDTAVLGINRHAECVHAVRQFGPSLGDNDFLVGSAASGRINEQYASTLGGNEDAIAKRIARRSEREADWGTECAIVLPEEFDLVFESVAVGIG